ncbi:MAG: hypothetical protein LCH86_09875 [Proteobacteria bacterium]|nr:hypothetical protein [Pseudomonadota bacterium]
MPSISGTALRECKREADKALLQFEADEFNRKAEIEANWVEALKFADEDPRLIAAHEANIRHNRRMAMWFGISAEETQGDAA